MLKSKSNTTGSLAMVKHGGIHGILNRFMGKRHINVVSRQWHSECKLRNTHVAGCIAFLIHRPTAIGRIVGDKRVPKLIWIKAIT